MAACVLIPGHSGFGVYSWPFYRLCFDQGGLHLGPVFALLGAALYWLVKARVSDRRWTAAHILTLTAIGLAGAGVALC